MHSARSRADFSTRPSRTSNIWTSPEWPFRLARLRRSANEHEAHVTADRERHNERVVVVGLAVGAGLAIATRYVAQRAQRSTDQRLVDWQRVEDLAAARLAKAPGSLTSADLHSADADYERAVASAIPLLEQ